MSKEAEITLDKARELVANPLLWPRVRDFLWDFAPQVHASWLDARGLGNPDSPRVKAWLLKELGVAPCFHAFPKEDASRLLLLDGKTLLEIVRWLGALACAEELRRVTDGSTVRALKAALPGVYPAVFGYTAYFEEFVSRGGAAAQRARRLEDEVVPAGCRTLLSAVAGLPAPLAARLGLKLPKTLSGCGAAESRRPGDDAAQEAVAVILKLLKLKFPEAYSLCCS